MTTAEERIALLEEQVAYWKSEAIISADVNRKAILQMRLGLTPHQAHILTMLYAAAGKPVRRQLIIEDLPCAANALSVQLHRIRKKIPPGSIDSVKGSLFLTEAGIQLIRETLES